MGATTVLKLDAKTRVIVIADRQERDPYQFDLFTDNKDSWMADVVRLAQKIPTPFYFSELRMLVAHEPPDSKWWGCVAKKLLATGFCMTNTWRRSPRESRKGGKDFQWTKKPTAWREVLAENSGQ